MKEVKEHKKVARFDNEIVDKNLLKFEQKLTINQQKVLYYLIIQEKNENSLQGITWNVLQELVGISSGENYSLRRKKEFLKDVQKAQLGVVRDEKNMEFHYIFPSIGLRYNKFYYTINSEIKALFNQPLLNYYLTNYELIRHFKHEYSIKLYELLNKQLGANDKAVHDFRYKISELRDYFNLKEHEYEEVKDLRKWVLEPSLREISDFTDINIAGKYNAKTKKMQRSSKKRGEELVYIRGISRKTTVNEYVQEQFDNAIIAKEVSKTKINKESKVTNIVRDIEESNEVSKDVYGEFKHVLLSKEQYEQSLSLFADSEELNKAIQLLDDYLEQNPEKHYANHLLSLSRFSKAIIEKQKIKEQYKANCNYGGEKPTYVEPTYEKYEDHESSPIEFDNITDEEKSEILNNIFGTSTKDTDNSNAGVLDKNIPLVNENSVEPTYPNYEGIEITEQQEVSSDDILEPSIDESNNKEFVQLTNESIDEDELRKEALYQYLEDTLPTSMSPLIMMEEPIMGMLEKLYVEVERLYFSFHDGKIDEESARKELVEKEVRYEHKLTYEEKYELNRVAREKWEAIPF